MRRWKEFTLAGMRRFYDWRKSESWTHTNPNSVVELRKSLSTWWEPHWHCRLDNLQVADLCSHKTDQDEKSQSRSEDESEVTVTTHESWGHTMKLTGCKVTFRHVTAFICFSYLSKFSLFGSNQKVNDNCDRHHTDAIYDQLNPQSSAWGATHSDHCFWFFLLVHILQKQCIWNNERLYANE